MRATSGQGLTYWSQFAASHGKAITFPEWGLVNPTACGDTSGGPSFVQNMHDWMATHNVAWHVYFDVDPNCSYIDCVEPVSVDEGTGADHELQPEADPRVATHYPVSSALYKKLFSLPLISTG